MKTALTIAGSDSSGGAGIQADIKTMMANGVYAMSALTALTAQNTLGVKSVMEVSSEFLKQQIDAVFEDIFPDAVKIGMTFSRELIEVIADRLRYYGAKNIVLDPVMVSTSGSVLLKEDAREALEKELFPMASLITPNIPEAETLTGKKIRGKEDMEEAALYLGIQGIRAVLIKGGHAVSDADDLLYANGRLTWFHGRRIHNPNTHGTGCTLSSAIASLLARGRSIEEAIGEAKEYLSLALSSGLDLGKGNGPLNHGYRLMKTQ